MINAVWSIPVSASCDSICMEFRRDEPEELMLKGRETFPKYFIAFTCSSVCCRIYCRYEFFKCLSITSLGIERNKARNNTITAIQQNFQIAASKKL